MPYDIRKRNCRQAGGKKGKYVVVKKKSKGRTEQESCHTSKKKAKGAVRARYASESNEGETVKITLEELRKLISEAMAEVTRPLPVYEEDADAEILTTYEEGEDELEEAIETTVDPDVVKNYLDSEGGAAGPEDTVAAVRDASDTDDDQALSDDEVLAKVKDVPGIEQSSSGDLIDTSTLTEAVMVALRPMIKPVHQEMTQDDFWMKVAGIKAEPMNEGEVVDMFSDDQKKQNAVKRLAHALAARAEKMLDADGDGDNIAVHVDHELFLSPYKDLHGRRVVEVPSLAEMIYKDYISGKAGDQAESLDSIIERISIDYFDEDIEYALESLGDDRFTMPHTYKEDEADYLAQFPDERGDPHSDDYDEDPSDDDLDRMFSMFLDRREKEMEAVRSSDNVIPLRPEED